MFLSEIAGQLSSSGLSAWELTCINRREAQLYSIFHEIENVREVTSEEVQVRAYILHERDNLNFLGESSFTLMGNGPLDLHLKSSMERARLIANKPFSLPSPASEYPSVQTFDSKLEGDPLYYLDRIHKDFKSFRSQRVQLSSSEILITNSVYTFLNSNGLSARRKETEIMIDFVLLSQDHGKEGEADGTRRCRLYDDLNLPDVLGQYSSYARDMLTAETPKTGVYDVVFSGEALDTFFSYFVAQAGGQAAYQGWSQFEKDRPIVGTVIGEKLTLISDPFLPGGMTSKPFDENGLVPKKVQVIEENIFRNRTANKRYADYLGIEPTGDFANVIVSPGKNSFEGLLSSGPLLYILKFSTFQPNPVTGAFSGEIRVAYVINGNERLPIKGGSVSGTMSLAMQEIYFSKEITKRESYMGPLAIKVCNLHIGGQ